MRSSVFWQEADRIEGTLFGNGERTGNVDIITLAMNMFSQGVDPELDFSNMSDICEVYERVTRMHVSPRQPYAGELDSTAFPDLIKTRSQKVLAWRKIGSVISGTCRIYRSIRRMSEDGMILTL